MHCCTLRILFILQILPRSKRGILRRAQCSNNMRYEMSFNDDVDICGTLNNCVQPKKSHVWYPKKILAPSEQLLIVVYRHLLFHQRSSPVLVFALLANLFDQTHLQVPFRLVDLSSSFDTWVNGLGWDSVGCKRSEGLAMREYSRGSKIALKVNGILADGVLNSYKCSRVPINGYRQTTMSPSQHNNYHNQF